MARIPVAILGATGAVGQRFVQLLATHPWFEIAALAGSPRSAGRRYGEACHWILPSGPPEAIQDVIIAPLEPGLDAPLVFSALPADAARDLEPLFAQDGYVVCSNASAFRQAPDVPLIVPEVNADHLKLIPAQLAGRGWKGFIVTSPNCTTTGIALAVKPLHDAFDLRRVFAVSMQAVSGAGYPGVASLDVLDNVLPYIDGEEEKIERETRILLGHMRGDIRSEAEIVVSAQANRVPVVDGHTICLSLQFARKPSVGEAIAALAEFRPAPMVSGLPSAPRRPVQVRLEPDRPQPRRDRDTENGTAVTVGRIRSCPLQDLRLVSLVHNTLRGGAGGAVLNAELLVAAGLVKGL
jgi:aspartate-semialdehyde dehydrogenase